MLLAIWNSLLYLPPLGLYNPSIQICFKHSFDCTDSTSKFFFLFYFTIKQQEQDPTNLYISNLPLSMDEQELENMLKHFGQVVSTRILRDSSGRSRGVGFARSDPCVIK